MRIPSQLWAEYRTKDPEAALFLDFFDEEPGGMLLEVGAQHNNVASMLASQGYRVIGVDLRPSDQNPGYVHVTGDFCAICHVWNGLFDIAVSISAIEHFGLNTYGEGKTREYYDVVAMRRIYDMLKPGGVAYITMPFGGKFVEVKPHWRVYDFGALMDRIVQDFQIELFSFRVAEAFRFGTVEYKMGDAIPMEHVLYNTQGFPGVSCILKLRKATQ